MNSADAWHEDAAWPTDPNGSLVPILEASVEEAKKRHPSSKPPIDAITSPGSVVLTGADRCDQCTSTALYRVRLRSKLLELDWCRHHFFKYFPEQSLSGWAVVGANPELFAELEGDGS